jgi:hypothetical protein
MPLSVRGAVDFIHVGDHCYNVADLFIIGATPLFLLTVGYLGIRDKNRTGTSGSVTPTTTPRSRKRTWVSASAGLLSLLVVGLGAVNYGGVTAPVASAGAETHR